MLHIECSCQTLGPIEFLRGLLLILPNAKYFWPLCHVSICTCNSRQGIKIMIYCSRINAFVARGLFSFAIFFFFLFMQKCGKTKITSLKADITWNQFSLWLIYQRKWLFSRKFCEKRYSHNFHTVLCCCLKGIRTI